MDPRELAALAVAAFRKDALQAPVLHSPPCQGVSVEGGKWGRPQYQACRTDQLGRRDNGSPSRYRHAWTNGFVERLQATILHEHWRVALRRRWCRRRYQLQGSLDEFLKHYNFDGPHQGYRTEGRTPAEIFWGAVDQPDTQEV